MLKRMHSPDPCPVPTGGPFGHDDPGAFPHCLCDAAVVLGEISGYARPASPMERGPFHEICEAGCPRQVKWLFHWLNLPVGLQAAVGRPGIQRRDDLLLKRVTPVR
jgi:hypothetical protein